LQKDIFDKRLRKEVAEKNPALSKTKIKEKTGLKWRRLTTNSKLKKESNP
jgi:hypothetical protein